MHEIILHSQIAVNRQNQVLQILAGITAMQPVKLLEQCLIFQQLKSSEAATAAKKGALTQVTSAQRLRYHKLVRDIRSPSSTDGWKLVVEETPDAGFKDANARAVSENTLTTERLERFWPGSDWYKFITQYLAEGFQFVHGNVVIRLTRKLAQTSSIESDKLVDAPPPAKDQFEMLDKSGSYVVEAYIHTEDSPSPSLREKATEELMKFAKSLEGAVDLRPINRLALETSVRGA